ncbi:hypothetical protein F4779DRAFT_264835 [Xylariaceae sp. FL0662B]|nr:hypothetical protein F4779DRAFT_264835 [Xylariaceae sp. FL0662B]
MITQRIGLRALRQAPRQSNAFFSHNLPRLAVAANVASLQVRGAATTTQKLTSTDAQSLLASQRLRRPISPHLTVYDYAQTWLGSSIWTRITGGMFAGGLYAFSAAYLFAPLLGWHLESAVLAEAFAGLPLVVKSAAKFLVAWPFLFHAVNGCRHLFAYDLAKGFGKTFIARGSWFIWGTSLVGALGLALFT